MGGGGGGGFPAIVLLGLWLLLGGDNRAFILYILLPVVLEYLHQRLNSVFLGHAADL